MVVLSGGAAMFQDLGEHTAKECNVSCDRIFASVTVIVVVSLGAKPAQAEGECWFAHSLHIPFFCHRVCCVHLITLPTHPRWLKVARQPDRITETQ